MKGVTSNTVVPGASLTSPQTCPPTGRRANPLPVDSRRNCGSEATYKGSTREKKFRFTNNFALTAPGGGATDRSPQPSPGLHASLQGTHEAKVPRLTYPETRNRDNDGSPVIQALDKAKAGGERRRCICAG